MNKKLDPSQRYSLGALFPDVHFNQREIRIMISLLRGQAPRVIAKQFHCTARTVLFYIESIKKMLACESICKIIELVKKSSLAKETSS